MKGSAKIQYDTLAQRVKLCLRNMILTGELAQGQRIRESALAEEIGVSRACLREAAIELEQEGLLKKKANHYTEVVRVTTKDAADILELRNMIELMAVEHWSNCDQTQVQELKRRADMLHEHTNGPTINRLTCDMDFHEWIVIGSKNMRAVEMWQRLSNLVLVMVYRACTHCPEYLEMGSAHFLIADAIEKGDVSTARRELKHHLNEVTRVSCAMVEKMNTCSIEDQEESRAVKAGSFIGLD